MYQAYKEYQGKCYIDECLKSFSLNKEDKNCDYDSVENNIENNFSGKSVAETTIAQKTHKKNLTCLFISAIVIFSCLSVVVGINASLFTKQHELEQLTATVDALETDNFERENELLYSVNGAGYLTFIQEDLQMSKRNNKEIIYIDLEKYLQERRESLSEN